MDDQGRSHTIGTADSFPQLTADGHDITEADGCTIANGWSHNFKSGQLYIAEEDGRTIEQKP